MSIRKNNKQVAGNYVNLNFKNYTNLINKGLEDITNTGDTNLEHINQEATSKISTMNNILNDVISNGDEKINKVTNIVEQFIQIAKRSATSSVGSERVWRGDTAPINYIFLDGQEVSREKYSDLFQWAIDNNLIIEDTDWRNLKKYGLYSYGNGSTTFRLPNMTGYYLVGYDAEHHTDLGAEQLDMLPNITGSLTLNGTNNSSLINSSNATGVFNINTKEAPAYPITGSTTLTDELVDNINFDLSREFNTGDRVQPRSIPVKYIVCYKNIWNDIQIL